MNIAAMPTPKIGQTGQKYAMGVVKNQIAGSSTETAPQMPT